MRRPRACRAPPDAAGRLDRAPARGAATSGRSRSRRRRSGSSRSRGRRGVGSRIARGVGGDHHRVGHVLRCPASKGRRAVSLETPFGAATATRGSFAGVEAVHVSRHLAGARAPVQSRHPPGEHLGAQGARGQRRDRVHGLRRRRPVARARVAGGVRRSALSVQPAAGREPVHILHRARRSGTGSLDPSRRAVLARRRAMRWWPRRRRPAIPRATAAPTATSTARGSTRRPRSPSWRAAASPPSARPPAPRPCCAASSSCRSR